MLLNATAGLEKNITPNREKAASNEAGSRDALAHPPGRTAGARTPGPTLARTPAPLPTHPSPRRYRRARLRRRGPMLLCLRHNRYPEHSRRILLQVPSEPDDPAARVAVPITPEPRPMRALVLHLRSVLEQNCCGSLRVCVLLVAGAAGGLQALTMRSTSEVYEHARVKNARARTAPVLPAARQVSAGSTKHGTSKPAICRPTF